jgi:hypothetical protein
LRLFLIRLLLALVIPAVSGAQAQFGKPDALPLATAEIGAKPPPLPPAGSPDGAVAPLAPAAPPTIGQTAPRCAPPLASGCLSQQSSCQLACPPQWSMNPNAPAFTPTDRAGCMGQCLQRYLSCMQLYGCN